MCDRSVFGPGLIGRRAEWRAAPPRDTVLDWFQECATRVADGVYAPGTCRICIEFSKDDVEYPASRSTISWVGLGFRRQRCARRRRATRSRRSRGSALHRRRGDAGASDAAHVLRAHGHLEREEQRRRWSGDPAKFEPLLRAQLKSRVWKISVTEPVPEGDPFSPKREDRVEGEGVHRPEYPILEAGGPPFEYQSCVERENDQENIIMSGEFVFVEGTLSRPAGEQFVAECPGFILDNEEFLFLVNRSSGLSVYGLRRRRAFATRACAFPAETSARLHSTGRQRFSERASNLSKGFFPNAAALSCIRRRPGFLRGRDSAPRDDATPPLDSPLDSYGLYTPGYRSDRSNTSDDPVPVPVPRERPGFPREGGRREPLEDAAGARSLLQVVAGVGNVAVVAVGGNTRCVSRRMSRRRACGLAGRWIRRCVLRPGCGGNGAPGTRVLGHGWFHGAGAGDGTTPPTSPRASFRRPKARGPGTVGSSGAPGGGSLRDARRGACRRGSPSHERRASSEGRPRAHLRRRDPTRSPRRVRLSRTGARRGLRRATAHLSRTSRRGDDPCVARARGDGTDASRVTMRAARRAPTSLTTRAPSDASTFVAEKNAPSFRAVCRRNEACECGMVQQRPLFVHDQKGLSNDFITSRTSTVSTSSSFCNCFLSSLGHFQICIPLQDLLETLLVRHVPTLNLVLVHARLELPLDVRHQLFLPIRVPRHHRHLLPEVRDDLGVCQMRAPASRTRSPSYRSSSGMSNRSFFRSACSRAKSSAPS